MKVTWTDEQKKVIKLHGRNLLVSAAAGSGKTAVLVERIIQMILNPDKPVDIDRLLVVTFTNAAAAEMRERIGTALEKALEADPHNLHLQKQVTLIHHAQISTIHSFCLQVIRSHFYEIDLDPGFRIGDEREIGMLKEDVMDQLLEEAYAEADPDFIAFADSYGSTKSDSGIRRLILSVYEYANSYPWPEEWLDDCLKLYQCRTVEEMNAQPWMDELMNALCSFVEEMIRTEQKAYVIARESDGPGLYEEALRSDLAALNELLSDRIFENWYRKLESFEFLPLSRKKQTCDPGKKEQVKQLRNSVKDRITEIRKTYFSFTPQEQFDMLKEEESAVRSLTGLARRFGEIFAQQKEDRGIIDFSDIEHFALKILIDPETKEPLAAAREYRERFEEVMIDEYQDSNYVQEAILQAVSRGRKNGNLFMVGDVKQSIYRFRLARPELFMEKYRNFSVEDGPEQKIDLHKNFRSRKEVLDFTNNIFCHIMAEDMGNIEYDEAAALYPGAFYEEPADSSVYRAELTGIVVEDENADKAAVEARSVALKIREMTEQGVKGEWFPEYGDIVILVHALKGVSETFVHVFAEEGIPLVTDSKAGYFSAPEVQTMIEMLRVLDNPLQDIPLVSVMSSKIGGFSSEELARIRAAFPDKTFCECAVLWKEGNEEKTGTDDGLKTKICRFWEMIDGFRTMIAETPVHLLIQEVFKRTGYLDYVSALPAGRQRRANLDMLLELAVSYENTSYQGLFHFVRYIEQMLRYEMDYGEAELVNEHDNAVRLMTIHKSKGLEFPVVFLCGMSKEFNMQSLNQPLIFHPRYGIGLKWMNGKKRMKRQFLARQVFGLLEKREMLGEELRLLYVALTRAREKLILTGVIDPEKAQKTALQKDEIMSFDQRMSARCFWDWVLPCVAGEYVPWKLELQYEKQRMHGELNGRERMLQRRIDLLNQLDQEDEEQKKYMDMLNDILSWKYPFEGADRHRQKVSVSELKHRFMEESMQEGAAMLQKPERTSYIPKFADESAGSHVNDGALRGTAMHRVLECLDFASLPEEKSQRSEWICGQIERMRKQRRITSDLAERLNLNSISKFLCTETAERMAAADRNGYLFRERPFVMSLSATEVWEDARADDTVLVQGIVDVFWTDEKGITLLDYKTDRVRDAQELIRRYQKQLILYSQALSKVFDGLCIDDILIYSFRLGQVIRIPEITENQKKE